MPVIDHIVARAEAQPDRAAVVVNGRVVTYAGFARDIARARAFLHRAGVPKDRVAALCMSDLYANWVYGLALRTLGITTVCAGTAEIAASLDLGPAAVIADVPAVETLGDGDAPAPGGGGHILLTSGTTGRFKKVLIAAEDEDRIAASNNAIAGLTAESVVNVFEFGGFTAAGYNWPLSAWSLGACAVIHQGEERWRSFVRPGLTHAIVTPFFLSELLKTPGGVALANPGVRLFVVGGMLSPELWRAARERLTADIVSIYGATETCLATYTPLAAEDDLQRHRIAPGAEVQVVDEADRPLPPGEVGRVRTRPTRVDGYLDDPEATAAFFKHGYFYSGDLAVFDGEGRMSLRGRTTDVVNVLGNKYQALPIETALEARLGAQGVCVFSAPDAAGEQTHVAIQLGRRISAGELRAALAEALPPGTANVKVHSVTDFPRNAMGKIERASLMARLLGAEGGRPA